MPTILIADDNESLRKALKDVLSGHHGWTICGEATNGQSAVQMCLELKPDLVILDFLMPLINGLAAAAQISKTLPSVPIVLYTMHMSTQLEREAKRVGVAKVLSKTEPFEVFVSSLEELLTGSQNAVGPLGIGGIGGIGQVPEAISPPEATPDTQPQAKPPGDTQN